MKTVFRRKYKYSYCLLLVMSLPGCGGGSATPPSSQVKTYKVIDLGLGYAADINEKGEVTGIKDGIAYIYDGKTIKNIGTIGSGYVSPAGINILGQVAATYRPTSSSSDTSVAYYSGTTWTLLGKFGSEFAWANDINDAGKIAGTYKPAGSANRAFIYSSGTVSLIPVPGKAPGVSAYNHSVEINNAGVVSGTFIDINNDYKAYIYDGTNVAEPGTIADPLPGRDSYGAGINDLNHLVGVSQNSSYLRRAFLYSSSAMKDLGTLGNNSEATDINNSDIVVGYYVDTHGDNRAFIHDGSKMRDLTSLVNNANWVFQEARKINNAGQIIGKGLINNEVHGFLIIPPQNPLG